MNGHGRSIRDVSAPIRNMYDTDVSAATLAMITDKVIPLITQWQSHPLDSLYCIAWLNAMYYIVRQDIK